MPAVRPSVGFQGRIRAGPTVRQKSRPGRTDAVIGRKSVEWRPAEPRQVLGGALVFTSAAVGAA